MPVYFVVYIQFYNKFSLLKTLEDMKANTEMSVSTERLIHVV